LNRVCGCLVLLACCLLGGASAQAVDMGETGSLSGSYRNLFFAGRSTTGSFTQNDLNRLRLEWNSPQNAVNVVGGNLTAHIAYDHEFTIGSLVPTPDFQSASRIPEHTWIDAEQTILQRGQVFWRHRLYRGWVNWDNGALQLKLGRQRIAWGSGRMWNPTDRFNPVDPTSLEIDQKTGVDSAFGEWRYSGTGAIQVVAAPGNGAHALSRKTALRMRDTFGEADIAVLAGRIGGEDVFGADISANVLEGGLHGELLHARPAGYAPYSQLSAGYEYTVTNALFPSGLYLLGEYFYNGAAGRNLPGSGDRLNSTVRHLAGFSAGYDITPLIRLAFSAILDPVKGGAFAEPSLTWSLGNNLELSTYCLLFGGNAGSEYGGRQQIFAMQFDAYF
jgi:hypothetical protein